jgi:winged helix DNA-binding protein
MAFTWPQVLAWRMRRQFLDLGRAASVEDVVRRLGAVQAQADHSVELGIRLRQQQSEPGVVAAALANGRIIKCWVMRGAVHLLTPEDGGAYLALMAEKRQWELPSWQSFYGLKAADWEPFRATVREALADGPLTLKELGAAVTAHPQFRHLVFVFDEFRKTLLKPLCWQGVMCLGPSRDGERTFQRLDANPRWAGLPDPEQAGASVVETYLRAYGPATIEHLRYWQNAGEKKARSWLASLGDRVAEVEVEGERLHLLREDLAELAASAPSSAVRLLPGYDQWVLGPGTSDAHVVPRAMRTLLSRQAPFVIAGGVVSGTWQLNGDHVAVSWSAGAGSLPRRELGEGVERLAAILDRPLQLSARLA